MRSNVYAVADPIMPATPANVLMCVFGVLGMLVILGGVVVAIDGNLRRVAAVVGVGGGGLWMLVAIMYALSRSPVGTPMPVAIEQCVTYGVNAAVLPVVLALVFLAIFRHEQINAHGPYYVPVRLDTSMFDEPAQQAPSVDCSDKRWPVVSGSVASGVGRCYSDARTADLGVLSNSPATSSM